jgi:hypothetical protein
LDDEMFPRKTFEMDAASDASEESFASVRAEEGADSDIELFEEPPHHRCAVQVLMCCVRCYVLTRRVYFSNT